MFDIGFWELLIIAVVLLLVLGPERLPEVAKQAAYWVRKIRQSMFRLRNEMRSEIGEDPFQGLKEARAEVSNFKNDMKQFGRDLADSHEDNVSDESQVSARASSDLESEMVEAAFNEPKKKRVKKATSKKKRVTKKKTVAKKKVVSKKRPTSKKTTSKKKVTKKASKKAAKKNS